MATLNDFLAEWHNDSDFVVAHTSGSTGQPKEIHLLKADMLQSARATNSRFNITESSTLAIPLSMDYIAGKMMAVRAIAANCSLIELPVSNSICIDRDIDLISVVPSQLACLLKDPEACRRVGTFLVGGSGVDDALASEVARRGIDAVLGYGMTETCSHVALRDLKAGDEAYVAMPDVSFETDSRGCLVVIGDKFSWKRLVTNDIVDLIDATRFRWLGRADNVINSGGIKVSPEMVESYLRKASGINLPPFYIVGVPSSRWGTEVAIVVQAKIDEAKELVRYLRKLAWPKGWKPGRMFVGDRLPQTANGKLKRSAELADFAQLRLVDDFDSATVDGNQFLGDEG